jgi:hypothetical protein
MKLFVAALCAAALACAACNETVPAAPSVAPATLTETFTATIGVSGSNTHPVTVQQTSKFVVTLVSADPAVALGIAVGSLSNGTCVAFATNRSVTAGGTLALSGTALPGSFCVEVFDVGTVVDTVTYTISVAHS